MENYIGLILDERNDHYTIGYRQTSDLQKLKEWKKEMLECSNVTGCKILKVEEIKQSGGGMVDALRNLNLVTFVRFNSNPPSLQVRILS